MNSSVKQVSLTAEQEAFLRLTRSAYQNKTTEIDSRLWPEVHALSFRHQIDTFLFPRVSQWPRQSQPTDKIMELWKRNYLRAAGCYLHLELQAREILVALDKAGVDIMPLKGITLASRIYPEPFQRTMTDIDLAVRNSQLETAGAIFISLGYTTSNFPQDRADSDGYQYRRDTAATVELQWNILSSQINPERENLQAELWRLGHRYQIHGATVTGMPLEDELLHLVHHIQHHALAISIRAYLDIALFLRTFAQQIDFRRLRRRSNDWKIPATLSLVLQITEAIFGNTIENNPDYEAILKHGTDGGNTLGASANLALAAILDLNHLSIKITAAVAEVHSLRGPRKVTRIIRHFWRSPTEMHRIYPGIVRRHGLILAYLWRLIEIPRRSLLRARSSDKNYPAALDNYQTRHRLLEWLNRQNQTSFRDCASTTKSR